MENHGGSRDVYHGGSRFVENHGGSRFAMGFLALSTGSEGELGNIFAVLATVVPWTKT